MLMMLLLQMHRQSWPSRQGAGCQDGPCSSKGTAATLRARESLASQWAGWGHCVVTVQGVRLAETSPQGTDTPPSASRCACCAGAWWWRCAPLLEELLRCTAESARALSSDPADAIGICAWLHERLSAAMPALLAPWRHRRMELGLPQSEGQRAAGTSMHRSFDQQQRGWGQVE